MKQIIIINKDLKMRKGKIAVQAAHGEVLYMNKILGIIGKGIFAMGKEKLMFSDFKAWIGSDMHKIVLKATEQEMIDFELRMREKGIWTNRVHDLGKTQIPENSFTCLILEPLEQSEGKQFKLL